MLKSQNPKRFRRSQVETSSSLWTSEQLKSLLNAIARRRVLVVGDIGVDLYTIGTAERLSPEAPVPVMRVQSQEWKLGLAGNVANNIRSLGGLPSLVSICGQDRGRSDLLKLLKKSKIETHGLIVDSGRPTVVKERVIADRQQVVRIDYETPVAVSERLRKNVLNRVKASLSRVQAVIIEDYSKGLFNPELLQKIFKMAKNADVPVLVDPKGPMSWYRGATLIKPNLKEAEKLSGMTIINEETLRLAGQIILDGTQAKTVVISRGQEGMAIFTQRGISFLRTFAREVYDVSGAGDTVMAVLGLSLAAGSDVEPAAALANCAAGIVVGKRGTATVTPEEIVAELHRWVG